ncbi:MAG: hypothetical protein LBI54_01045 [Lachnospiraceae bacterium]|jgi:hypothetical protein|nr:hypothetical protein [Lachnospiraceae bacterium]
MKTRKTSTRTLIALVVGLSVLLAYLPTPGFSLLSKAAEATPDTPLASESGETAETPATDEAEEAATDTPASEEPSDENEIEADEQADTEPDDTEEAVAEDIDEAELDEQSEGLQVDISFAAATGGRETEPNDTKATATEMPLVEGVHQITGASQSQTDEDYYKFTLTKPGKVNLSLVHTGGSINSAHGWEIYVCEYDTDAEIMSQRTVYWHASNSTMLTSNAYLSAGNYYIRVKPYTNYFSILNVDYTIRVLFDENTGQYETESNDTRETATAIALNKEITGNLDFYTEKDFYKIVLPGDGRLNIKLADDGASTYSEYWKTTIFNESGQEELFSFNAYVRDTVTISSCLYLASGTYFIRVEGFTGSTGVSGTNLNGTDYHLTALFEASTNGNFEVEANNSAATANPISWLQTPVTGNLHTSADVDHYEFTVAKAGDFYLRFTHENLGSAGTNRGWKVELYNEVGGGLGFLEATMNSTGMVPTLDSAKASLSPGRYFAKVTRLDGSNAANVHSDADYSLSVRSDDGGTLRPSAVQNIQLEIVNYYDFATEEEEGVHIKVVTYDDDGVLKELFSKDIPADTQKVKLLIWGGDMDPLSEAYEWRY